MEQLLEIDQIQKTLQLRIQNNPLKYYWPHSKGCDGKLCDTNKIEFETFDGKKHVIYGCPQYTFHSSLADTRAFFGGNRSGKTTSGAVEISYHATGKYPDWWEGRKWDRPVTIRCFASDFQKGLKVVTKKLREWLPKDSIIHVYKNNQKAEVEWHIKHASGGISYIDMMTYEQDPYLAEGWSGDIAWFDEPPPRATYIATVRGLVDSNGICLFTLTPLKEPWLFDEIYNTKDPNITSVLCDLRHNLERYNPFSRQTIGLREESIRKFEMKLTEEERETRMHGKFRYLAGRIWKEWDRDIHTFDRSMWIAGKDGVIVDGEPPTHWPRCMLIDPHDRNPHALLWIACDETEEYWVYREMYCEGLIGDIVKKIKQVELDAREKIQIRIMDPNFGPKKYANSGLTVRDEFEQEGRAENYKIRFTFGDDRKEIGRKAVGKLFRYDTTIPISFMNHPRLKVADNLKDFIYQVEHYVWDDFRIGIERDPKEQPKEMNTHFPDLLHYFALSKFGWNLPFIKEGKGSFY